MPCVCHSVLDTCLRDLRFTGKVAEGTCTKLMQEVITCQASRR